MKIKIALGLLVGAVLGLLALNLYEARVIAHQRELIVLMWQYIQQACPIR